MPSSNSVLRDRARQLRRNQTDAESLLWSRLRDRRFEGFKFRRQQVIGPFIVDFCCTFARLVIEVDGGQHVEQATSDARRSEYLQSCGYQVIRFWSSDVLQDLEGVLERIAAVLATQSLDRV